MKAQQVMGLSGAVLGLLIAVIGGIANGIQFAYVLLRSLASAVLGGLLFMGIYTVAKRFLPDLVGTDAGGSIAETLEEGSSSIDITLDEEDYIPDQAHELRAMRSQSRDLAEADENSSEMIEEVVEDSVVAPGVDSFESFSEEAFYSGINELPDIGGFADNFAVSGGSGSGSTTAGNNEADPLFSDSTVDRDMASPAKKSKSSIDPKMMAQAISTALKKDNL
jgi:hypothetical protein